MTATGPLLRVRLEAGYGRGTSLHEVKFDLHPGERVGLVGTSGAGKSTLVLALLGLLPWRKGWARGEVLLDGRNLLTCTERELRQVRGKAVALVPQSPATALNPALSIGTHFAEAWKAHAAGDRGGLRSRMSELLGRVRLPTDAAFCRRRPQEISIGQAQRVLIALALLHRPSLLIADEPTSALDVCTQDEIVRLLHEISREQELTLLYVSHDLLSVFRLCARMLVMGEGRIVDDLDLAHVEGGEKHTLTRNLLATLPVSPAMLCGHLLSA